MTTATRFARIIGAAALAGAAVVGAAAGPAAAWPIPLTSDEINYLNATRGTFPGDDDQLLLAGRQMCRGLYMGQSAQAVIDAAAAQYGASPDQASAALRAARGTLCTQAPG